ncbi:hypothetical protein AX17_006485 [Amanita inopinata Kibby_2008]|nr:hypothetical protein AX17_006485 [Amanita inopinata Kibby_2008]
MMDPGEHSQQPAHRMPKSGLPGVQKDTGKKIKKDIVVGTGSYGLQTLMKRVQRFGRRSSETRAEEAGHLKLGRDMTDFATLRGFPPYAKPQERHPRVVTNDHPTVMTDQPGEAPTAEESGPSTSNAPLYFTQSRSDHYSEFTNELPHAVQFLDKNYRTAVHLIEALKYMDHAPAFAEKIRECKTVKEVYKTSANFKWKGRKQKPKWAVVTPQMLDVALYHKFTQHEPLRRLLLDTGSASLVYQDANDGYYGVAPNGRGLNVLGEALVRLRNTLRTQG